MREIDARLLERLLPMGDAVDALDVMFAADDPGSAPPRVHAEATGEGTLLLMPATSPRGTGVKILCTTSPEPVFDGRLLTGGAHVNAVGACTPDTRELDEAAVSAGPVVVEQRDAALTEAGDLLIPLEAGVIDRDAIVADLFDVCRGDAQVRANATDVTVFKSVGLALEDLAVVTAVADRLG